MTGRSVEWLEHIAVVGHRLIPVYVCPAGKRRNGRLDEAQARLHVPDWRREALTLSLPEAKRVHSGEYLNAMGFPFALREGHMIYEFAVEAMRVQAPAAVLLHALLGGRLNGFGTFLLSANGLSQCAVPLLADDGMEVRVHRRTKIERTFQLSPAFQSYMAWVVSHASARRMWGSVYRHAEGGVLGLDMPLADISCNVQGTRVGDTLFARKITVRLLHPNERPLLFAAGRFPEGPVEFRPASGMALIDVPPKPALRDERLVPGESGYELTDDEWERLKQSAPIGRIRKVTLNRLLSKLGKGLPWRTPGYSHAEKLFRVLLRTGRWDRIRAELTRLRSSVQPRSRAD